jgi:hypothetical protein
MILYRRQLTGLYAKRAEAVKRNERRDFIFTAPQPSG